MNIRVDNSVLFSSFFFWHIFIPKRIAEAKNAHNLMANCSLIKKLFNNNLGIDSDQCTEYSVLYGNVICDSLEELLTSIFREKVVIDRMGRSVCFRLNKYENIAKLPQRIIRMWPFIVFTKKKLHC